MKLKIDPEAAETVQTTTALLGFLRDKLAASEQALRAQELAEACGWRLVTSESWRSAGCKMTKLRRLWVAKKEGRIAEKHRIEVAMFRALIAAQKTLLGYKCKACATVRPANWFIYEIDSDSDGECLRPCCAMCARENSLSSDEYAPWCS